MRSECESYVCPSALAGVCRSSGAGMEPCLSHSTGSICPLRGREKEANSKTGKQLQLGSPEVLQVRPRLSLLGRNSWRETEERIARTDAAWTRFPGQVRSCVEAISSVRASGTPGPTLAVGLHSLCSDQISNASKCLSRFLGRCGWGSTRRLRSQSRGMSAGSWAVDEMHAGASLPSLPPQLRRLLPTPFRPAAVSEIARRPRIH